MESTSGQANFQALGNNLGLEVFGGRYGSRGGVYHVNRALNQRGFFLAANPNTFITDAATAAGSTVVKGCNDAFYNELGRSHLTRFGCLFTAGSSTAGGKILFIHSSAAHVLLGDDDKIAGLVQFIS